LDLTNYSKENLWQMLTEAVHASVMYKTHMAYTRDVVLKETPNITHIELSQRLNITLGEAIVLLHELTAQQTSSP
jgi:hypothetical protein